MTFAMRPANTPATIHWGGCGWGSAGYRRCPIGSGDPPASVNCRPSGDVWTTQPGRTYQTCFWLSHALFEDSWRVRNLGYERIPESG